MGEREAQIEALAAIRAAMDRDGIDAEIVADEWCNTLEDIIAFSEKKRWSHGTDQDSRPWWNQQRY